MELTERFFVTVIGLVFGLSAIGLAIYGVQQINLHLHHVFAAIK